MHTETISGEENFRTLLGMVVSRNGGKWHRFILTILRNEADAEDVLQEAIRRVLSRHATLYSEDQIRMYLGRAISNAALEFFNSRKRDRLHQQAFHSQEACLYRNSGARAEERDQQRERERLLEFLNEGLKNLPEKQYEALRLTILDAGDNSMRDAGSINGIPYSTLRHRTKQGLKQLRKFIIARGKEKDGGWKSEFRSQETEVQESGDRRQNGGQQF